MDFEEIIWRLRNNMAENNCHDCSLGYVAFEAADALEGLLKADKIRETPCMWTSEENGAARSVNSR